MKHESQISHNGKEIKTLPALEMLLTWPLCFQSQIIHLMESDDKTKKKKQTLKKNTMASCWYHDSETPADFPWNVESYIICCKNLLGFRINSQRLLFTVTLNSFENKWTATREHVREWLHTNTNTCPQIRSIYISTRRRWSPIASY